MAIHLRELGAVFIRQAPYRFERRFLADFMIWPHQPPPNQRPPLPILLEVQGGIYSRQAHGSISGILKDNERLNEATIAGYRMMRVTPDQVKSGEAKATIARALGSKP